MAKYEGLAKFLAETEDDTVTLKFDKVAALVPGGLPQSAYDHRPWWANRFDGNGAQNQGWQSVGWETSDVDMNRQTVTFNRTVKRRSDFKDAPYIRPLSIVEAKAALAAHLGVPKDNIEIIVRG
jgi:hypothetical protein